jgi:hypothetical protein
MYKKNNKQNNKQNNTQLRRVYFDQTTLKTHHHIQIILLPLPKFYQSFISTHNRNLQTPITHRNHRKIPIPRTSPDAVVEQKTIQKMGRPPDEPTESGKPRATDEKRLARIPATK